MTKSIKAKLKKRGRPATGKDPMVGLRIEPGLHARVDEWGSRNDISRSEAIRRLLEKALTKR